MRKLWLVCVLAGVVVVAATWSSLGGSSGAPVGTRDLGVDIKPETLNLQSQGNFVKANVSINSGSTLRLDQLFDAQGNLVSNVRFFMMNSDRVTYPGTIYQSSRLPVALEDGILVVPYEREAVQGISTAEMVNEFYVGVELPGKPATRVLEGLSVTGQFGQEVHVYLENVSSVTVGTIEGSNLGTVTVILNVGLGGSRLASFNGTASQLSGTTVPLSYALEPGWYDLLITVLSSGPITFKEGFTFDGAGGGGGPEIHYGSDSIRVISRGSDAR